MNDAPEAETGPPARVTIDWEGITIPVEATLDDVDPDFFEAMEDGKTVTALRALLTSKEYERVRAEYAKAHGGKRPTRKNINDLANTVAKHYGFGDEGE